MREARRERPASADTGLATMRRDQATSTARAKKDDGIAQGDAVVVILFSTGANRRDAAAKPQPRPPPCAAICRSAASNCSTGCPPWIRWRSLMITDGTALIPASW